MSNLSKAHFFDAGANPPRSRVVVVDGQRRVEKIPNGKKVELWVNPAGVSVWQVIVPGGVASSVNLIDERRAVIRRRPGKWFRRHTCPLEVGELGPSEFPESLQRPCTGHSKGLCPHARFAITKRQAEHKAGTEARHAVMRRRETERKEREAQQLAATLELNDNIRKLAETAGGRGAGEGDPPADKPQRTGPRHNKGDTKES